MPSGFPGSIDSFTNPLTTSALNSPSHAGQHQDLNDAVNKVEQYMGLVKVIPTSVSSAGGTAATLAANGTVNIGSANTSITVNGAFTSLYDNYKIVVANVTGSGGLDFRMQLSGLTTSVYNYGVFYATSGTTGNASASSQTFWTIGSADAGSANSFSVDLYGPFTTSRTAFSGTAYGNNVTLFVGGQAVDTNSRTGFVLLLSTGNISGGTIRVYGYRN